ncbi:2-dehydropantoate 2-reductase [Pontibacter sp. BT310]|uniref:2-dehydropantoate 2-reductase n=1 Tax=Pontibacter populi TaxID=890055 RepID=A0ABS6XC74_9BACT|nr:MULTISPECIES: 2-dehydropantoate 2-reductase [Pontibacter]MBJ6118602.1 2-dehydropantoate 2-reductase [Pontibacter sp. BT310]MBR0571031.1 2-dehydropantoate 2-reductase [Microvirga sp. STS03]MBW3365456.1 2-dehydropantoate 2-reductase [Pontibacter populi]
MMKIAIAGIGGVGGYFGGLLARHYQNSDEVEIYFIARGENETAIRQQGLKIETPGSTFTATPKLVISDPAQVGEVDLLICCTKSYDLEQSITQLKPCISKDTIILPLLNGIDSYERIKAVYPENEVWEGCVYIVSRLTEPGLVTVTGDVNSLFFGSTDGTEARLESALQIFTDAGIKATLSQNIQQTIWEKYLFISTIATLTSYFNTSIGGILAKTENMDLLHSLLSELKQVANAKGIMFPENSTNAIKERMAKLPYETTSSMHTDYQKGKNAEVDSLTGYVVKLGKQLNVPTPTYEKLYTALKNK